MKTVAKAAAQPLRVKVLGGVLVVLGVVYVAGRVMDTPQSANTEPARPVNQTIPSLTPMPPQRAQARRDESSIQDFKPTLKLPEGTDVSRIDPTLRLDLLAKLQQSELEGGGRSLFDFGAAPKPIITPPTVAPIKPITPPVAVTPPAPVTPPKPVTPPIPLKFYGYVNNAPGARRQAFFLDGEDIFVAGENDTIRNRYKIIRIGVNSAVVEDTTNKNQQTLPLVEEQQG